MSRTLIPSAPRCRAGALSSLGGCQVRDTEKVHWSQPDLGQALSLLAEIVPAGEKGAGREMYFKSYLHD